MLRDDRLGFGVLRTMPFMVEAGAEGLPWFKAILAKEGEHARRPERNRLGHCTVEEWQASEAIARRDAQQQRQQHQQRASYQYAHQQRAAYQYAQQQRQH